MSDQKKSPRSLIGKVVGISGQKTVSVQIERTITHPLYGKIVRRTAKILAHDEHHDSRKGDWVMVSSTKPISKRKVWRLEKVLEKAT